MTTAKAVEAHHTQGPWTCDTRDGGVSRYIESATAGATVAKVADEGVNEGEFVANARLIAAAPELLAAAVLAVEAEVAITTGSSSAERQASRDRLRDQAYEALLDAIRKATGS